ncbi:MAG: hypothetical protein JWN88_517 [Frankiales bacterium]|jgi:hypothetical protein|nr:hypothetical protein [Frankiales bacterium]
MWTSSAPRHSLRRRPAGLLAAACLTLALAGCGDDEDPQPSGAFPPLASPSLPSVAEGVSQEGVPKLINLVVTGGAVSGVDSVVPVPRNTPVRLTVLADTADVLLVRGYDVRAQITVGEPVQISLLASRAGDAAVVLERTGTVLTTLRVS